MTFNRTDREAFAALSALSTPATITELFATGLLTTVASETLRHGLGKLVAHGLAQHQRCWRKPGTWQLLPGAVMPPGKVRALRPDDCPPQRIIRERGTIPPALLERIGLAGLCRQMTGGE